MAQAGLWVGLHWSWCGGSCCLDSWLWSGTCIPSSKASYVSDSRRGEWVLVGYWERI